MKSTAKFVDLATIWGVAKFEGLAAICVAYGSQWHQRNCHSGKCAYDAAGALACARRRKDVTRYSL